MFLLTITFFILILLLDLSVANYTASAKTNVGVYWVS